MFDSIEQGEEYVNLQRTKYNALLEQAKELQQHIDITARIIDHAQNEVILMHDLVGMKNDKQTKTQTHTDTA